MVNIIWTKGALEDLNLIAEYISKDSKQFANLFVEKILNHTKILKKYPMIGRIVPEIQKEDTRELIYKSYRIIYKVVRTDVVIHSVFRGSQIPKLK